MDKNKNKSQKIAKQDQKKSGCSQESEPENKFEQSERSLNMPYQYDPGTNTIHLKDCPVILDGEIVTQGYESWKTPLRKGYKPCNCCKDEYKKAFRERNTDILERTQYTYVYTADSKIFHKYSCGIMLSVNSILGTVKYETVIKTGRRPCKLCNPTPEDDYRPSILKLKADCFKKKIKKTVSKNEVKAIMRQKVASDERHRRLNDGTLTQQEINDIYTLTQPRFAFWAGQGYQTFHLHSCSKLREISNLHGFSTYKDAVRAGYTPCRKCRPTAKQDAGLSVPITNKIREHEKAEDFEAMCAEAGYPCHREGLYLYMETPVGKWRINISRVPLKIDHINLVMTPDATEYHGQPRIFLSFTDTFDYIKRHDTELARKQKKEKQ